MLAFKYISYHYIKFFLIILIALSCFVIGWDYMAVPERFLTSANLLVIYLTYKIFYAIDMLLPLSLVFGMISTKVYLIRSNALVSFFSLGYSRIDILKPFVVVSSLIISLFILLHTLPSFSRANEYANNTRIYGEYLSPTTNLFFVHKNKYIYFSKMIPLQEKAENIRVFNIQDDSLKEVLIAKNAYYRDNYWYIKEADIIKKPNKLDFNEDGISIENKKDLKILHNFRPKVLDQVYEGKVNFTIGDAIDAFLLLKDQNINTDTIKGALYKIFVYPLFVPFLVIIIFFFVPLSSRSLNISLFSFGAILLTLIVWAILFAMVELANNKTISAEVGIILPIFILFLFAMKQLKKDG